MNEYEKILELTEDSSVELAKPFLDTIGKEFCLGMSKYVAEHGTLSDGHEHITDAGRYYQANKEIYHLRNAMLEHRVSAMKAQADLLDARERLLESQTMSETLRAEADALSAENRLFTSLVSVEDSRRVYDTFVKVRNELRPKVLAQYPEGLESAQKDIYVALAHYRFIKKASGYGENLTHVPLDKETKTRLGFEFQSPDLHAWAIASQDPMIQKMALEYAPKNNRELKCLNNTD